VGVGNGVGVGVGSPGGGQVLVSDPDCVEVPGCVEDDEGEAWFKAQIPCVGPPVACASKSCAEKRQMRVLSKIFFFKAVPYYLQSNRQGFPARRNPVFAEVVKLLGC